MALSVAFLARKVRVKTIQLVALLLSVCGAALAQGKQIPPGVRQADHAEVEFEKNVPPPAPLHTRMNFDQQRREAEQLAALAKSIAQKTEKISNSTIPKGLDEDLRHVEKIARRLRSKLTDYAAMPTM